MPRLTVTITEDQSEFLEELSGDGGEYESKSAAVRKFIRRGEDVHTLEEKLERRERRIEELEEQLARRSEIEEKIDEVALAVQDDELDAPFFVEWYRWYRSR